MAKERYKIEARNSELKHRHGYDVASSSGLIGIEMQGAMAIFAVNLKRIIKLISENKKNPHARQEISNRKNIKFEI